MSLLKSHFKNKIYVASFFLVQFILFKNYIERECASEYILHGDPTWYIYFNYKIFSDLISKNFTEIIKFVQDAPWGVPLFFQTTLIQVIFGPSRTSVCLINLLYYLIAQVCTYLFFKKIYISKFAGWFALLFFLALGTPFRKDGPGLNISDFHFDLILFFILLLIHYLYFLTNNFENRKFSIYLGLLIGLCVSSRLVSLYLLATLFGGLGLCILIKYFKNKKKYFYQLINFSISAIFSVAYAITPLIFAKTALYNHYFRFVFDKKFAHERAGLYVMGADSKLSEANELIQRMLKNDFGNNFFICLIIAVCTIIFLRILFINRSANDLNNNKYSIIEVERLRIYNFFLIWSALSSFILHLIFPIKSDHLTRMTAAPLFIFTLVSVLMFVSKLKNNFSVYLSRAFITFILILFSLNNQLSFYLGKGRYADSKIHMVALQEMYHDMVLIVANNNLSTVKISVDRVDNASSRYCLGAMYSFFTFAYEKYGLLLRPLPQLGGVIDEPIELQTALNQISQSDFVLIGELPYQAGFPFNISIYPHQEIIHSFVIENFKMYKDYKLFGSNKKLFVNKNFFISK